MATRLLQTLRLQYGLTIIYPYQQTYIYTGSNDKAFTAPLF